MEDSGTSKTADAAATSKFEHLPIENCEVLESPVFTSTAKVGLEGVCQLSVWFHRPSCHLTVCYFVIADSNSLQVPRSVFFHAWTSPQVLLRLGGP